MIKVPATAQGIPAIQQLISDGINVNVTLLFAQEAYEQVAQAYIAGLEQFAARAAILSVWQVSPVFLSAGSIAQLMHSSWRSYYKPATASGFSPRLKRHHFSRKLQIYELRDLARLQKPPFISCLRLAFLLLKSTVRATFIE
jgi:Transaldolase/Fructose-6-phosphate aldolase